MAVMANSFKDKKSSKFYDFFQTPLGGSLPGQKLGQIGKTPLFPNFQKTALCGCPAGIGCSTLRNGL